MPRRKTKKDENPNPPGPVEDLRTLGTILREAREAHGWSTEEVSRMLRVRPVILREVENDDLGSFSHASYARMSILGYARLLGLPEEDIRSWLPAKGAITSGEFTYLDRLQNPEPAARRQDFAEQRIPQPNPVILVLKIMAVLLLLGAASYAYFFWHNLGRLQTADGTARENLIAPTPNPVVGDTSQSITIESGPTDFSESSFRLKPRDAPTPFLEQDALALDLQITPAPPPPALPPGDEQLPLPDPTSNPEIRPALPVEAGPVQDPPVQDPE